MLIRIHIRHKGISHTDCRLRIFFRSRSKIPRLTLLIICTMNTVNRSKCSKLKPSRVQFGRRIFNVSRILVKTTTVRAPLHLAVVNGREHRNFLLIKARCPINTFAFIELCCDITRPNACGIPLCTWIVISRSLPYSGSSICVITLPFIQGLRNKHRREISKPVLCITRRNFIRFIIPPANNALIKGILRMLPPPCTLIGLIWVNAADSDRKEIICICLVPRIEEIVFLCVFPLLRHSPIR